MLRIVNQYLLYHGYLPPSTSAGQLKICAECAAVWVVLKRLNWMDFPIGHSVLYIEFKLCSLKNLKLFSIRVEE